MDTERTKKMREAGRLTAAVLEAVTEIVRPGITPLELDAFCENYIVNELKATPGSKGQYDYPFTINSSVNHVICLWKSTERRMLI